ncbi:MAG: hypothetical protein JNL32_05195 [Candidatus Kapabacteria bacterium]|nr:hypothetical protein [Candidatus Kapabacteria bacterium]
MANQVLHSIHLYHFDNKYHVIPSKNTYGGMFLESQDISEYQSIEGTASDQDLGMLVCNMMHKPNPLIEDPEDINKWVLHSHKSMLKYFGLSKRSELDARFEQVFVTLWNTDNVYIKATEFIKPRDYSALPLSNAIIIKKEQLNNHEVLGQLIRKAFSLCRIKPPKKKRAAKQ